MAEVVKRSTVGRSEQPGELSDRPSINILILGETGVGKSTWINAFLNYLYFDTLEEAIEGNKKSPVVAIPSKFTMYDDEGDPQEIFIGEQNVNEVHSDGASCTQQARTYPFQVGDFIVNLIDTPGIGDTRGALQDAINMDNVLAHISNYDEIHAILILLKPNNARLGILFKHCIQQLLTHLHKSAAKNIAFVFTNTRQTFYRPGETLIPLKKLLREKEIDVRAEKTNMFCFDNEAFRFLASSLPPNIINLDESHKDEYAISWGKACEETKRLFEYIRKLEPHAVKNTVSLNYSRKIIEDLSEPIKEFAATIRKNIENMDQIEMRSVKLGLTVEDIEKCASFTLEHRNLDSPRTVCVDPQCTEICHDNCGCKGGSALTSLVVGILTLGIIRGAGDGKNNPCKVMDARGQCTICNHPSTIHEYKTYEFVRVKKPFISEKAQAKIDCAKSEHEKAEIRLRELRTTVKELKDEEQEVHEIAAGFAAFLKTFALIPFNDAMGDYMDKMISDEAQKPDKDEEKLKNLEKYKADYENQKQNVEKHWAGVQHTDQGQMDAAKYIQDLKDKTFGLKHFGKDIEKIFEKREELVTRSFDASRGQVPPRPKSAKVTSAFVSWFHGLITRK